MSAPLRKRSKRACNSATVKLADVKYADVLIFCAKPQEQARAMATITSLAKREGSPSAPQIFLNEVYVHAAGSIHSGYLVVPETSEEDTQAQLPLVEVGAGKRFLLGPFRPASMEGSNGGKAHAAGTEPATQDDAAAAAAAASADAPKPTAARVLSWVLVAGVRQGPENGAAAVATYLHLLQPKAIVMLGMCAGHPKKVRIGDVVIGGMATNLSAGKVGADKALRRDMTQTADDGAFKLAEFVEIIPNPLEGYAPAGREAKSGAYGSGAAVDESGEAWCVDLGRKYMAFDMEASAFFTAVTFHRDVFGKTSKSVNGAHGLTNLGVVKGVMDFATAASRPTAAAAGVACNDNGDGAVASGGGSPGGSAESGGGIAPSSSTEREAAHSIAAAAPCSDVPLAAWLSERQGNPKEEQMKMAVRNATVVLFEGLLPQHAKESFNVLAFPLASKYELAKRQLDHLQKEADDYKTSLKQCVETAFPGSSDEKLVLNGRVVVSKKPAPAQRPTLTPEAAAKAVDAVVEDASVRARLHAELDRQTHTPSSRCGSLTLTLSDPDGCIDVQMAYVCERKEKPAEARE